jgi:Zn-dependent peptidase ImmA (M78 family)
MKKKIAFKLNPNRIKYLMDMYHLTIDDFIELIHRNSKRKIQALTSVQLQHVLNNKTDLDLSIIKVIDKTFQKGLTWYISERNLPSNNRSSIFFRKDTFNSELNFESKKKINEFEQRKIEIQTLCKFINFDPKRFLKSYNLNNSPQEVAQDINQLFAKKEKELYENRIITRPKSDKEFLKNSIRVLESFNIFVFEFIETWNKKNKVSFNGFYSDPNLIVIKRQESIRREIFTLFHEFGHYLINHEEIDCISENNFFHKSKIEKWCHAFSFYFLLGSHKIEFCTLETATKENDFYRKSINNLYRNTYLSYSAFYTRLRIDNKISKIDYDEQIDLLKTYMIMNHQKKKEQAKLEREIAKEQGKTVIAFQKPIESNLFKEIVKINYFEGNINESRLRDYLNIKPQKALDKVIY